MIYLALISFWGICSAKIIFFFSVEHHLTDFSSMDLSNFSQNPSKTIGPTTSCANNFHRSIFTCGKNFLFVLVLKVSHTVLTLCLPVLDLEHNYCVTLLVLSTCIIFVFSYLLSKLMFYFAGLLFILYLCNLSFFSKLCC